MYYEKRALSIAILIFGALVIFFSIYFSFFPSTRFQEIRNLVSLCLPAVCVITITTSYWLKCQKTKTIDTDKWFIFIPILGLSFAFLFATMGYFGVDISTRVFRDLAPDIASATILLSAVSAILAYVLSIEIFHFEAKKLSILLLTVTLSGFIISAIYSRDSHWWAGSLCALGMGKGYQGAFWIYNTSIVLAGLLLSLMGFYLVPLFKELVIRHKLTKIRLKVLTAIYQFSILLIIIVGLIPYGHQPILSQIHIYAGNMVFLVIGLTMLFSKLIMNKFKRSFYIISYLFFSIGVALYVLYDVVNYFTITFYELNSAVLIVIWVVYLIKYIKIVELSET